MFDAIPDLQAPPRAAADPRSLADVLDRALLALSDLLPYDLAAILELQGTRLSVRAARGRLATAQVRDHHLDLAAWPTIRRALELRRPIALTHDHHASAEGDPYDGVLDLPEGHACMVVPLFAGDRDLGVITLDRDVCVPYDPSAVHLAGVVGQVVALAITCAEQASVAHAERKLIAHQHRLHLADAGVEQAIEQLTRSTHPAMQRTLRKARQVAATDAPLVLTGEPGVGKSLLARAVHRWSARRAAPFVVVRCAALPAADLTRILLGDDSDDPPGRAQIAHGGTLLLKAVDDLPMDAQRALLQLLQTTAFDARIIATTTTDLTEAVARGRFRPDLKAHLDVFSVAVPPLRDRVDELPQVAAGVLAELAARTGGGPWTLPQDTLACLIARPWPGNVHQLRNALERATILRRRGALRPDDFGSPAHPALPPGALEPLDAVTRRHISAVLRHTRGRIYGAQGAARVLGLKPSTLQSRMKKLGIDRRAAARSPQGEHE